MAVAETWSSHISQVLLTNDTRSNDTSDNGAELQFGLLRAFVQQYVQRRAVESLYNHISRQTGAGADQIRQMGPVATRMESWECGEIDHDVAVFRLVCAILGIDYGVAVTANLRLMLIVGSPN